MYTFGGVGLVAGSRGGLGEESEMDMKPSSMAKNIVNHGHNLNTNDCMAVYVLEAYKNNIDSSKQICPLNTNKGTGLHTNSKETCFIHVWHFD